MKTEIALDKLCNIVPIISGLRPKIKEDEELKALTAKLSKGEDGNVGNIDFLLAITPILFKTYRTEVYQIIAIVTDKTIDEIKEQSFGATVKQIKELIEDEDLRSFFTGLIGTKEQ